MDHRLPPDTFEAPRARDPLAWLGRHAPAAMPLGLVAGVMPILAVSWGLGEMLRAAWRSPDKRTLWDRAGGTMVRYRRGAPSGWGTAP